MREPWGYSCASSFPRPAGRIPHPAARRRQSPDLGRLDAHSVELLSTFVLQLEIRRDGSIESLDSILKRLDPHALAVGKWCQGRERFRFALQRSSGSGVRKGWFQRSLGRPVGLGRRSSLRLLRATVAQHRNERNNDQL